MARPKNLVVVFADNTVVSVAPSKLKEYLTKLAAGEATSLGGKTLGSVNLSMAAVTQANAREVLTSLFPDEVAVVPQPIMAATPTPATDATPTATVEASTDATAPF
jgi:protein-disulfide isomerase